MWLCAGRGAKDVGIDVTLGGALFLGAIFGLVTVPGRGSLEIPC